MRIELRNELLSEPPFEGARLVWSRTVPLSSAHALFGDQGKSCSVYDWSDVQCMFELVFKCWKWSI